MGLFLNNFFEFIETLVECLIKFSVSLFVDVLVYMALVNEEMGGCYILYKLVYE